MENFFSRYRNPMVLGGVLLLQVLGLAVQVKRSLDPQRPDAGSVRLLRLWVEGSITPVERVLSAIGHGTRESWHDYVNVVGLRHENDALRQENEQLHLRETQLAEDARQAQRLQALLQFKEQYVKQTVAAQVIGSSGTEQSRVLYLDKGARDGLRPDMAVITPQGVVGKVRDVFPTTSQALLMNDPTSGVGALLEQERLFGVVKGTAGGGLMLDHIMSDEKVQKGEPVVTSGGDRIFPKGLPIGMVEDVSPGSDLFLNVRIRPAADLDRLEEVLVITEIAATEPDEAAENVRAADILAQRLPTLKPKPEGAQPAGGGDPEAAANAAQPVSADTGVEVTRQSATAVTGEQRTQGSPKPKPASTGQAAVQAGKPATGGPQ